MKFIGFLLGIIFMIMIVACGEETCDYNRKFTFDLEITGASDTLFIGDTIKYYLEIPHNIVDETKNEIINIENWNPKPTLGCFKVVDDSLVQNEASFLFDSTFIVRYVADSSYSVTMKLIKEQTYNYFEGYVVCNARGKYMISIFHFLLDAVLPDCENRYVIMYYQVNDGNFENNYHLLDSEKIKEEVTAEGLEQYGGVVFVVN